MRRSDKKTLFWTLLLIVITVFSLVFIDAAGYAADPGSDAIVDNFLTVNLQLNSPDPVNFSGKTGDDVLLLLSASLSETTIGSASSATVKIYVDENEIQMPTLASGKMFSNGSEILLKTDPESGVRYITFDIQAGESVNAQIFFTVPNGISRNGISATLTTFAYDAAGNEITDASNVNITRKVVMTWNAIHQWDPVEESVSHSILKMNASQKLPEAITYSIHAASLNTVESGIIFTKHWSIENILTFPQGISLPDGVASTKDGIYFLAELPFIETNCSDASFELTDSRQLVVQCDMQNLSLNAENNKQEISNPDIKMILYTERLGLDPDSFQADQPTIIRSDVRFLETSFFDVETVSSVFQETEIPEPAPDFQITKSASLYDSQKEPYSPDVQTVVLHDFIRYDIVVENKGAIAGTVDVVDSIPFYTVFSKFEEGDSIGKLLTDGDQSLNVVWSDQTFASGEIRHFIFYVQVTQQGSNLAQVDNFAYVITDSGEKLRSNTVSHKFAQVEPDIRLNKKAIDQEGKEISSIHESQIPSLFSYQIEIHNFGVEDAVNRKVADPLPDCFDFVSADKAYWMNSNEEKVFIGSDPVYDSLTHTVIWENLNIPGSRSGTNIVNLIVQVHLKNDDLLQDGSVVNNEAIIYDDTNEEDRTTSEVIYKVNPIGFENQDGQNPGNQNQKLSLSLQKSVLAIGTINEENHQLENFKSSLFQYQSGVDDGILFDVFLWNDTESTKLLPVDLLIDWLPEGFQYRGITRVTDSKIGADSVTTNAESEPNYPVQSEKAFSRISAVIHADYRVEERAILFSVQGLSGEKVFLEPGQCIEFGIICQIEKEQANNLSSQNHIAFGFNPTQDGSLFPEISDQAVFIITRDSLPSNISENAKKLSIAESSLYAEVSGNSDLIWYETSVSVAPAMILPGVKKEAIMQRHGGSAASFVEETEIGNDRQIEAQADVQWKITISNFATHQNLMNLPIENYVVKDIIPVPYSIPTVSENYPGGFIPIFSLFDSSGSLVKSIIIPESAQTVTYRTVVEEAGSETLSLQVPTIQWMLNGDDYEIPDGYYAEISFWTIYHSPVQETGSFTNTVEITFSQEFNKNHVNIGTVLADGKTISAFDTVFFRGAYQSFSYMMVTDLSEMNSGSGYGYDAEHNAIETKGPGAPIEYTMNISNSSSREFKNLVVINKLPAAGDFGNINLQSRRGSDFSVLMDVTNPVTVSVIDAVDTGSKPIVTIDPSHFRVEFTANTAFTKSEWSGQDSHNFHADYDPNRDTGFRIVFDESVSLQERQSLMIQYRAIIGDDARSGETAWNTFGYAYQEISDQIVYVPEPTKVGVRISQQAAVSYGRIRIEKTDQNGSALAGASFTIYSDFRLANPMETITTDPDGFALSNLLPLGTYWVRETAAPNGYIGSNRIWTVELSMPDQTVLVNGRPIRNYPIQPTQPQPITTPPNLPTPTSGFDIPFLPETGFPANRKAPLSEQPAGLLYKTTGFTLEIPILNVTTDIVSIPINEGKWEVKWLGNQAGLFNGSEIRENEPIYIAAHNHLNTAEIGPFLLIKDLNENDRIFITDREGIMRQYSVFENLLVEPDAFSKVKEVAESRKGSLILVTCEQEMESGGYAYRRVVFAQPVG